MLETKNDLKKLLKIEELIPLMKKKNIKFNIITEEKVKLYLKYNNNYYNIKSYTNNFEKYYFYNKNEIKYIDLDFAYLKDLSIIDHRLRLLLFKMIIDIEHYLKIRILNIIENIDTEDGYKIVNSYLETDYNNINNPKRIHNSIFKKMGNEYYNEIFSKYDIDKDKRLENIPIWEFLEIITFGELINFYDFLINQYNLNKESQNIYILREIGKLRNAVAHNTCVLSNLKIKDNKYPISYKIIEYLRNCNIGAESRKKRMSNTRIKQITYTLYFFNEIVTSDGVKSNVKEELNDLFFNRIIYHKEYYNNNDLLKSIYQFFKKIIEKYY